MRTIWLWLLLSGFPWILVACDTQSASEYTLSYAKKADRVTPHPIYTFAVHPLHNPKRLFSNYQPLISYINKNVSGFSLKLVASRDYAAFEKKLYSGLFDLALPNPLQTVISLQHGYHTFAKMGDDEMFRGIIIMRRNALVLSVQDLEGGDLSFPAPTALAATMLPKYFLQSNGLNLATNTLHYVGSQESAIMNVFMGKTSAAGTWPLPWELLRKARPELDAALEVRWLTEPLVNNGIVARTVIPAAHVQQVATILLELHTHTAGIQILEGLHIPRFEPASDITYLPVQEFLKNYQQLFPDEKMPTGELP